MDFTVLKKYVSDVEPIVKQMWERKELPGGGETFRQQNLVF